MRDLSELDQYRFADKAILKRYGSAGDSQNGCFIIPYPRNGAKLRIIASNGDGWDHVSVSLGNRCPAWDEMCFIKKKFFKPEEIAMQFHPPTKDYINKHPYCLHLWRPRTQFLRMPPTDMV